MFCPNCGTQNPETTNTCTKCGFNLKGAAAPKFKGTMMMVNAPAIGTPEQQPAPAPPAPGPAPGGPKQNMKGTIVGVAPPAFGAPAPTDPFAQSNPNPSAPPYAAPGNEAPNPLGSTMLAPGGGSPSFPQNTPSSPSGFGAPSDFGAPPAGGNYGAPPAGGNYGAPPAGNYGAPPAGGGFGAPSDFGAPPANNYGTPPGAQPDNNYGAPPGLAQYGSAPQNFGGPSFGGPPAGGAIVPTGSSALAGGPGGFGGGGALATGPLGTIRNPILSLLSVFFCCPFYALFQVYKTEEELKRYLGKPDGPSILWFLFPIIPILAAPKLIAEARAKAGTRTQGEPGVIGYYFLSYYLFLQDANEIWESQGVRPSLTDRRDLFLGAPRNCVGAPF